MGIPDFYGKFLKERDKKELEKAILRNLPGAISSLCLDFNSIIHEAARQVFRYDFGDNQDMIKKRKQQAEERIRLKNLLPPPPSIDFYDNKTLADLFEMYVLNNNIPILTIEEELFQIIADKVLSLCYFTRPEYLIIAVDGLVPMAKIIQQRKRRYAKFSSGLFDTNAITPGTDFMDRFDAFMKSFVKINKNRLAKKIIYSGYKVEGEGEHKIMAIIRDKKDFPKKGNHLIYGLDSDLIVLTMMTDLENPFVFRHEREFISTNVLKKWLLEKYSLKNINDFSILTFLIGNDFLPRIPELYNLETGLSALLYCYKEIGLSLVKKNKVDFSVIMRILEKIRDLDLNVVDPELSGTVAESSFTANYKLGLEPTFSNPEVLELTWHAKSLVPYPDEKTFQLVLGIGVNNDFTEKKYILAEKFLFGIAWCYNYYNGFPIDKFWFYDYHYAPTLNNFIDVLFSMKKYPEIENASVKNGMLSIREQLLCVIPPGSIKLLGEYVKYVDDPENFPLLECVFPRKFIGPVIGGFNKIHEAPVLVPFPDMTFMFRVTGGIPELKFVDTNMMIDGGLTKYQAIKRANEIVLMRKEGKVFDTSRLMEDVEEEIVVVKKEPAFEAEIDIDYLSSYVKKNGIVWKG